MVRRTSPHHPRSHRGSVLLGAALALSVAGTTLGCGDDGSAGDGSSSAGDGGAGASGTGAAGTGAMGTGAGSVGGSATGGSGSGGAATGGNGGSGGAPPLVGPPGTETVSGGTVCESPSYRMVVTVGQPTTNQTTTTSPSYRLQGGLVGANESLP